MVQYQKVTTVRAMSSHVNARQKRQQQQAVTFANVDLQNHRENEKDEEGEEGDYEIEEKEPPCPVAEAIDRGFFWGWASYLTFHWAGPLLTLGASRTLTEQDLLGIGEEKKR